MHLIIDNSCSENLGDKCVLDSKKDIDIKGNLYFFKQREYFPIKIYNDTKIHDKYTKSYWGKPVLTMVKL